MTSPIFKAIQGNVVTTFLIWEQRPKTNKRFAKHFHIIKYSYKSYLTEEHANNNK